MENIINEVVEKLKKEFARFFSGEEKGIGEAERYFSQRISEATLELLRAYYEQLDRQVREDKAGRKEAGLSVERREDKREILTLLGRLEYHRTYYRKASGGYEYPVDEIAGVSAYERLSESVGLSLVQSTLDVSYGKSSAYVTGGQVSRQTVMNKLRQAWPAPAPTEYRAVPELHIDADEDHANLQNGTDTIVPLVSVYEGVEHHGKRGECRNIFHISEYGKSSETLWEEVVDELERRYDLAGTRIYLHGDGAAWIKAGLEYIPNCAFVLDEYHKNKAIRQAVSGIDRASGCQYEVNIRKALDEGNREQLRSIRDKLLSRYPDREKTITDNMNYLLKNFDAITIRKRDAAACNGGCTEPHVSHVLSDRLSTRPMGWSKITLEHLVPLLATGAATFEKPQREDTHFPSASSFLKTESRHYLSGTLGLADPDRVAHIPARENKVTPLFNALRPF